MASLVSTCPLWPFAAFPVLHSRRPLSSRPAIHLQSSWLPSVPRLPLLPMAACHCMVPTFFLHYMAETGEVVRKTRSQRDVEASTAVIEKINEFVRSIELAVRTLAESNLVWNTWTLSRTLNSWTLRLEERTLFFVTKRLRVGLNVRLFGSCVNKKIENVLQSSNLQREPFRTTLVPEEDIRPCTVFWC